MRHVGCHLEPGFEEGHAQRDPDNVGSHRADRVKTLPAMCASPRASATGREPAVVGKPATSIRSLTATRKPLPVPSPLTIHVDMDQILPARRPPEPAKILGSVVPASLG